MKYLNWDPDKNEIIKQERGISFEEIAYLIETGQIIGIEENPGRPKHVSGAVKMLYFRRFENACVLRGSRTLSAATRTGLC